MDMFSSFRSKLLLFIICILVVSSAALMLLTRSEIAKTMHEAAGDAARNQLLLVRLNVENEYKSILYHKDYAMQRYKEQIRNVVGLVISHIDDYHRMYEQGILTEEQARELAARSVRKFKFGNNDYFFIYDMKGVNISHPDPSLYRKDLSQFKDVKGKFAVKELVEIARTKGSGYSSFWYIRLGEKEPVEKLSYIELYKPWNWIVGTGVYVDDVKKDGEQKLASALKDLGETFNKITIGKTGYFFLFNKEKVVLLHPSLAGKNVALMKDAGGYAPNHFDRLIKAAENPSVPLIYLWDKPPDHANEFRFWKESYVDYFPPLGWYIASSVYKDELDAPARTIIRWQTLLTALILTISIFLSLLLVQKLTHNLKTLTLYARRLSATDFSMLKEIGAGITSLTTRSKDEISRLADAFVSMIASLIAHIEKLKETTAAKEKIENELKIAHNIQMSMVPHPPELLKENFQLFAVLEPAKDVGGDFYDFFFVDDTHLCLVIGDVSDKGVPAALFMAKAKTVIRLLCTINAGSPDPADVLAAANNELCRENDHNMFVTLFLGLLDVRSGSLSFASAGHNPPYLIGKEQAARAIEVAPSRPLGIRKTVPYTRQHAAMQPGESLFLYTDGVTEAMDIENRAFTEQRLVSALEGATFDSPRDLGHRVLRQLREYSHGVMQSDDITILSLKFMGDKQISDKE